jgi:hypothetical protein
LFISPTERNQDARLKLLAERLLKLLDRHPEQLEELRR